MADNHDLMQAIADTNTSLLGVKVHVEESGRRMALVFATAAIANAVREVGIRIEIAIREASGRG